MKSAMPFQNLQRRPRHKGASIVEFALVGAAYFLLLLGIVEVGIMFWVNLTMQHAVREGARYAITGQSNLDPDTGQRYRAVIQGIRNSSMGLYDAVHPTIKVSIDAGDEQTYGTPAAYNSGMFGMGDDIVMIKLDCAWPIITPLVRPFFAGGQYRFSVAATMRNEMF